MAERILWVGLCLGLAWGCSKSVPPGGDDAGAAGGSGEAAGGSGGASASGGRGALPTSGGAGAPASPAPAPVPFDAGLLDGVVYRDAGSYDLSDLDDPIEDDAGVELMLTGPNTILVVVDRSGSMNGPWDEESTRWLSGNAAMIAALSPFREDLTLGGIQFPLPGGCDVIAHDAPGQYPFTSGEQFLGEWRERYPDETPGGSTPLEAALQVADRAIDQAIAAGLFEHKFKVMLITDGEPTCSDDLERIVSLPARWHERDVRTYVLGLPGSEGAGELLHRIAEAGGTGTYTAVGDPGELQQDIAFFAAE